ncbi:TetR/AcrR family transcriptional regulator [Patulibacter brassicae]|jgi:AcrR family transcriptional regulator|uniref:TetR/AcrR family transcriptional regulator n=1 Tax=Patulibacter brassicae TaxID=1705717 RepID=A0ABU4VR28_9ACTN|nr:TetR/AcrR family transcriptional regulator [Patulibacter brassicae]MDX8153827.1 TetR/AcrR family transcriptional regulator [Patulibacter brassicae]
MSTPTHLTRKGARRAEEILEATIRCLARDGYAATSLQRVAEEAGVPKRAIPYYFTSRDGLLTNAAEHLIARLVDQILQAVDALEDADRIIDVGFEAFWAGLTRDRAFLIAWLGLQTEAITNPSLAPAAAAATDQLRLMIDGLIDGHLARGGQLAHPPQTIQITTLAWAQGLALEWVSTGTTPSLEDSIVVLRTWLKTAAHPETASPGSPNAAAHQTEQTSRCEPGRFSWRPRFQVSPGRGCIEDGPTEEVPDRVA